MKYFGLYQQGTQAHFARVMLLVPKNRDKGIGIPILCLYYGNTINDFFYFSEKRHKIVEFFALLTTELSSYKMCKVGMLFCTLQASI